MPVGDFSMRYDQSPPQNTGKISSQKKTAKIKPPALPLFPQAFQRKFRTSVRITGLCKIALVAFEQTERGT